jgi:hypothetical protein
MKLPGFHWHRPPDEGLYCASLPRARVTGAAVLELVLRDLAVPFGPEAMGIRVTRLKMRCNMLCA